MMQIRGQDFHEHRKQSSSSKADIESWKLSQGKQTNQTERERILKVLMVRQPLRTTMTEQDSCSFWVQLSLVEVWLCCFPEP